MEKPKAAYGVPMVSVVGDGFCVHYPVELIIKKKCHLLFNTRFQVLDVKGNLLLQVDGCCSNFQKKRIMRDPAGSLILSMRKKRLACKDLWRVHRGESSKGNDLLFNMQRSYLLDMKKRFDVFLANNINGDISDFQVVGCCSSKSCKVYKGDSMVAEVNHHFTLASFFEGKDKFRVKVYPGVDHAFLATLIMIFSEACI